MAFSAVLALETCRSANQVNTQGLEKIERFLLRQLRAKDEGLGSFKIYGLHTSLVSAQDRDAAYLSAGGEFKVSSYRLRCPEIVGPRLALETALCETACRRMEGRFESFNMDSDRLLPSPLEMLSSSPYTRAPRQQYLVAIGSSLAGSCHSRSVVILYGSRALPRDIDSTYRTCLGAETTGDSCRSRGPASSRALVLHLSSYTPQRRPFQQIPCSIDLGPSEHADPSQHLFHSQSAHIGREKVHSICAFATHEGHLQCHEEQVLLMVFARRYCLFHPRGCNIKWKLIKSVPDTLSDPSSFSYTSGRFLFNETLRLRERHVEFNVDELRRAAEVAVRHEHGTVAKMRKLAEGGFNRVLLLTMQDGFEVIAKIPYRIARPEYYTTASEAATLTFLKQKGLPVPGVLSYCAKAANPVGSEYILMEKAYGVSISDRWQDLTDLEIRRLAHSFVQIEKQLFDITFGAIGSLYFRHDIPANLQSPLYERHTEATKEEVDQFCIGPIADYMFWDGKRADLSIDRGPWKHGVDYLQSIALKEIAWVQQYGRPREPTFPHNTVGLGVQQPGDYIKLLNDYSTLTPHLLPKSPSHPFNTPTLRHPDLTPSNVFVDPSTGRVSCLIDWQHAVIQPQVLAAGYPPAFANPDAEIGPKLIEPKLPENLATLPRERQDEERELFRRRLLFYAYRVFNGAQNSLHIAALRDPMLRLRHLLVDYAGRGWVGNLMTLKGALIRTIEGWEHLPDVQGVDRPVLFDQSELDRFAATEHDWVNMSFALELWRSRVCNMNEDGWVRHEDFDEAKAELRKLEAEVWSQCEGDEDDERAFHRSWPFRDHEENADG
nr:altered inheritance of mitochondria protein 9, mitochondrial [Quercus suber]